MAINQGSTQAMSRQYKVTIYNQHAMCGIYAIGRTRREAFNRALAKAGEPFIRYGGDKLTTFRTLFVENLMRPYYRTSRYAYASHPNGAGVEFRRID
jgi:hypothetical protein